MNFGSKYIPYEVYKNVLRMFEYRGIITDHVAITSDRLASTLNRDKYIIIKGTRLGSPVMVFILDIESKYTKRSEFDKLYGFIGNETEVMFVGNNEIGASLIKSIDEFRRNNPNIYLEYVPRKRFISELPLHILACRHTIASDSEIDAFCKLAHVSVQSFPKIFNDDPMVVWIGAKPGQCIRVEVPALNTGTSIQYCICIMRQ